MLNSRSQCSTRDPNRQQMPCHRTGYVKHNVHTYASNLRGAYYRENTKTKQRGTYFPELDVIS